MTACCKGKSEEFTLIFFEMVVLTSVFRVKFLYWQEKKGTDTTLPEEEKCAASSSDHCGYHDDSNSMSYPLYFSNSNWKPVILKNGGLAGRQAVIHHAIYLCLFLLLDCFYSLSASEHLPAFWRQDWPPCPGATPLPHSGCCRQELSFFSCLRSFWSFPGMWGGHTGPLTTLPQPLLLMLILAL